MRRNFTSLAVALVAVALVHSPAGADTQPRTFALIKGGVFEPFYAPSPEATTVTVKPFLLARDPVTNGAFLHFVKSHPKWRRDRVSRLFADSRYLRHWSLANSLGSATHPNQPVTNVSWFAGKAFCKSENARLPTEMEWEFAARASETSPRGSDDPKWTQRILNWYSKPSKAALRRVGQSKPNYWGVRDLHGLVWEWVLDFNGTLVSGDSRETAQADKVTFCGAGALRASDAKDYASFMRAAFRSSLRASYTTSNLGFRCARDTPKKKEEGKK
jgi:formylglycine-generating enzyme required for sulfatase activity